MPTNPKPGDATTSDANPNYGNADVQEAQTDHSKIATPQESLKALVKAFFDTGTEAVADFYSRATSPEKEAPQFRDGSATIDVDAAHQTATGSYQNGAVLEFNSPRALKELVPYFRDTDASGSATDWRLIIARDTSLEADDAPTGALSDGDGWLLSADGQVASGGDGPDWAGSGQETYTHLAVLQTQAVSAGTEGRAQLAGTEAV